VDHVAEQADAADEAGASDGASQLSSSVRRTIPRAVRDEKIGVMSPREAMAFVERHGVVLQAARGPVPSLAEAVAHGPIHGSWWAHPKGREIFRAAEAVCESGDVLVCKLVEGKVTYVHRRLWPALVKLRARFRRQQLDKVWNEHTPTGAHKLRREPFPTWVPDDVARQAERLSVSEAEALLSMLLPVGLGSGQTKQKRASRRTRG
jgi:hypothetical protein